MFEQVKKWLPFKRGEQHAKRVPDNPNTTHPLARMQNEMQHWMDRVGLGSSLWGGNGSDSWFGDFSPSMFTPTLDVADKPDHLEVTVELAGMDASDVDVDVRDGALMIRGEKRLEETTEEEGFYRTERSFGSFERAIPLPTEVDAQKTEAMFKNGVLKVRLPKAKPEPSATRVEVKRS